MSEETKKSLLPHIVIGGIVLVVILAVLFWPEKPQDRAPVTETPKPVVAPKPNPIIEQQAQVIQPEPYVPPPEPIEAPAIPEPEIVESEPLDTSDGTVKTKLLTLSEYQDFARFLIDESLLQRFVVTATSLADVKVAPNHTVGAAPEKPFGSYQQAGKSWIDQSSYKRYTPYVDVFESIQAESLIQLYQEYKPAIEDIFAEISNPNDNFEDKLKDAIDVLLDTPEVPVPVEVYTESVMFKFADEQLESLSPPQKQLLRTGPENMRRIKAKLREIKQLL